jgi:small basic protein (TIGR04137 family)
MTLDSSLKQHGGLIRTRSVLTRAERIKQLGEEGKFDPNMNSPFGLVKVKVKHSKAGHKAKKAAEGEGEAGAEGAAAPAAGAKTAAPAKGAAPTKGAVPTKGAAPAKSAAPAGKADAKAKK